jgi:hypothetical protein
LKTDLRNSKLGIINTLGSPERPLVTTKIHVQRILKLGLVFVLLSVVGISAGAMLANRLLRTYSEPFVQVQVFLDSGTLELTLDQDLLIPLEHHLIQGQQGIINVQVYHARGANLFAQDQLIGVLGIKTWYDPFQGLWVLETTMNHEPSNQSNQSNTNLTWFRTWSELIDHMQPITWYLVSEPMMFQQEDSLRIRVLAELPKLNSHLWILRPFLFEQVFTQYLEVAFVDL